MKFFGPPAYNRQPPPILPVSLCFVPLTALCCASISRYLSRIIIINIVISLLHQFSFRVLRGYTRTRSIACFVLVKRLSEIAWTETVAVEKSASLIICFSGFCGRLLCMMLPVKLTIGLIIASPANFTPACFAQSLAVRLNRS